MAKAKRIDPEPGHTVRLDLTEAEAVTLLDITRMIGGGGRRRNMDRINEALTEAGMTTPAFGTPNDVEPSRNAIYFKSDDTDD